MHFNFFQPAPSSRVASLSFFLSFVTCFGSPAKMICAANNPIGIIDSGSVVSPASSKKPNGQN